MGTKNNPGRFDCEAAAAPDEPKFTLLGRDGLGGYLVRIWSDIRSGDFENAAKMYNEMTARYAIAYAMEPDEEKAAEAAECAATMFKFRREREEAKLRVAEIDEKFDEATYWGSWMADLSLERRSLADKFGFQHKNKTNIKVD